MKHLTKENILLVLVSLLVLAQVKDMAGATKCPESACAPIKERLRGMARAGHQGPRVAPQKPVWLGEKRAEGRAKKKKMESEDQ